jgi:hypothetical protein
MLKVHRLALLLFSGLLCYGCQPHPAGPEQAGTPNILFVMFDDMGKEWVSAYGSESVSTPAIDALASDGMRFDNVWSNPQCTPTRLSLLTGQYPFRNGWVNHWEAIPVSQWLGQSLGHASLGPWLLRLARIPEPRGHAEAGGLCDCRRRQVAGQRLSHRARSDEKARLR